MRRIVGFPSIRSFSTKSVTMTRTYADAVTALNTLQSNFAVRDAIRKAGRSLNELAIPEMIEWTRKIGYQPSDFNKLNIVHIAGTKGKGSTSAFVSSILSQYIGATTSKHEATSKQLQKVGLYTSPHLRFVRERIQINNQPLSEEKFAQYFFEVWDRLEAAAKEAGHPTDQTAKPVYFRYLTLMAFHTYISEGVDAAIIECGIGGEYDSTNIIVSPVVTGITSLGIDHVAMLGDTIDKIAWQKAGIFKTGANAFTAPQPEAAIQVIKDRASEKNVALKVVDIRPDIANGSIRLGLDAEFQKINASVAIAVAEDYLTRMGNESPFGQELPEKVRKGLQEVRWGGRCETREEGKITWCIDGGHTLESIDLVGQWFSEKNKRRSGGRARRVLIFNQADRDANALARRLHKTLASSLGEEKPFDHVIFCTNTTFKETGYRPDLMSVVITTSNKDVLGTQKELAATWEEIDPGTNASVVTTIEEAIDLVREISSANDQVPVVTLVTGSLHLVGGLLEVLDSSAA